MLDRLGVEGLGPARRRALGRPAQAGGDRPRAAHAGPTLLMLDEPTNHLDAETVEWLEEELDSRTGALLLVTHDRYFLDGLVDRIVEVEPPSSRRVGSATPATTRRIWSRSPRAQEQAERQQHKRERWIAQEVAWLRQGRRGAAHQVEGPHRARAQAARGARLRCGRRCPSCRLAAAPRLVADRHRGAQREQVVRRPAVLDDVSVIVQPGERIGIVGRNGAGKTTLLRMLLGELKPDAGAVVAGKNTQGRLLRSAARRARPRQTVYEAALGRATGSTLGEQEDARCASTSTTCSSRCRCSSMKVKALSGGERNRLLLARLFLEGANVLVLDEPTNDLDLVTLNVLERLLLEFSGAVLLVTHDRYFLDKVATGILAFEGEGTRGALPGQLRDLPRAAAAEDGVRVYPAEGGEGEAARAAQARQAFLQGAAGAGVDGGAD